MLYRLRYETIKTNYAQHQLVNKKKKLLISFKKYKHLKMRIAQLHSFWAKNNENDAQQSHLKELGVLISTNKVFT